MANGEQRTDTFLVDPEDIVIIDDAKHALYDERIKLPLVENTVLDFMERGVLQPILCRRNKDGRFEVMDGRQRVRHLREANKRLTEAGKPPLRIKVQPSRAVDNEVFGNLASANAHRRNDPVSLKARNVVRYLDMGHTPEQAKITFNLASTGLVKNLVLLAEKAGEALMAALDRKEISFQAAYKLAKKFDVDAQERILAERDAAADGQESGASQDRTEGHEDVESNAQSDARASALASLDVRDRATAVREMIKRAQEKGAEAPDERPRQRSKPRKPRKLTAREVERKAAEVMGEEVALAPGKKEIKALVEFFKKERDAAKVGTLYSVSAVFDALIFALEFSLVGEAVKRPAVVDEILRKE